MTKVILMPDCDLQEHLGYNLGAPIMLKNKGLR